MDILASAWSGLCMVWFVHGLVCAWSGLCMVWFVHGLVCAWSGLCMVLFVHGLVCVTSLNKDNNCLSSHTASWSTPSCPLQVALMGVVRISTFFYIYSFNNIVKRHIAKS